MVMDDFRPADLDLHSSDMRMLEIAAKSGNFPSSSGAAPTSEWERSRRPDSPSSPFSSTSHLMTNPANSETNQYTYNENIHIRNPNTPTCENDSVPCETLSPLSVTFPTEVLPNTMSELASTAGDFQGSHDKNSSVDVVSALLLEDSVNGIDSLESAELLASDAAQEGISKDMSLLQLSRSMPSSPRTPVIGDSGVHLPVVPDLNNPQHETGVTKEESVHLVQSIFAQSEDLSQVSRTKSMPESSLGATTPKKLRRSVTEKKRKEKFVDDVNIRFAGEVRLSDRRKKKLLRKLATIKKDGAVEFDMSESSQAVKDLFGYGFTPKDEPKFGDFEDDLDKKQAEDFCNSKSIPPLKIVMLIVGTRGDVQPFIAIGKRLQEHGHRVRLASHKNFESFVRKEGLEFYPLGGDPVVLAGYMVKNKGFLPSNPSEIPVQREQIKSIVYSLLPACTEPDLHSGIPFQAQAIIANPPAYGHVHVAEHLKIPLHIFFTMPWSPTSAFPHPLSRVKQPAAYRMSYQVVDTLIWLGIRGIVNSYRKKKLRLRPITYLSGSQGSIAEMPTGYIWSPHLVPKPKDWGPLVDVVGFCFLNLATNYKPPEDLVKFLQAGPPPIYIGFGSLPVEDPEGMTKIIVEALHKTGQRGIIGKGWGGIGNLSEVPENVYLLSDCPHDWLFPQCAAVVHHGGAGTTSAGLKAACPTTVIPFFGDQPFWGDRVHEKGVGPVPIPVNHFTLEKLVHAIEFMLDPKVKRAAVELAKAMEYEDGVEGAVQAFHKHIHAYLPQILCKVDPPRQRRTSFFQYFKLSCFYP